MPADQNFIFHRGGVFPPAFFNQHVSFQSGAVNSALGLNSGGMDSLGGISNVAGMVLAGNTNMVGNVSSINPPCNSSGNTLLDPVHSQSHSTALSVDWSDEELDVLRQGLVRYANESSTMKYIKIAASLPEKTVRDVAMRCRWMSKKEKGKRRKPEDYYAGKKVKDRKEKMVSSSSSIHSIQPENTSTYSPSIDDARHDYQVSCEAPVLDSATQHLLVENVHLLNQIERNLEMNEIEGNIHLFHRTKDNITAIMNRMSEMPGFISRMPSLPVSLDEGLVHSMPPGSNQGTYAWQQPPERRT